MLAAVLALVAAAAVGIGAALQHRVATLAPTQGVLHPRLLVHLVKRPLWLGGGATLLVGYAAQILALGFGRLALVEPIFSLNVAFAVFAAARLGRRWLQPLDVVGLLLLVTGLGVFLLAARPSGGTTTAHFGAAAPFLGALAVAVIVVTVIEKRLSPAIRTVLLAVVAGYALGNSDTLTKITLGEISTHHVNALTTWAPYLLVAVGLTGFWLQQYAYNSGPMSAALPATSVLEPVTGTLLGVLLLKEQLAASPLGLVAEVSGGIAMVFGVWVLAASASRIGVREC